MIATIKKRQLIIHLKKGSAVCLMCYLQPAKRAQSDRGVILQLCGGTEPHVAPQTAGGYRHISSSTLGVF